jgi:hypothetical protein
LIALLNSLSSTVFSVVDADDVGHGNGLKAHSGGYQAVVAGKKYKNVHFDKSWVAYVTEKDDEVPPEGILNADGKLSGTWEGNNFVMDAKYQHPKNPNKVFLVNKQNAKTCNRFAKVQAGDVVCNGFRSVMSVSTDAVKANEYAGGVAKKGTIWEIITGNTGGKEIDPLSVIPPSHSDKVRELFAIAAA